MSYIEVQYPSEKTLFYEMLREQTSLYIGDETDRSAVLANASAVIAQAFPNANWVGFYLVDGDELVVGPFQGKPAVSRIGYGKGVCGTAWMEDKAQVVEEVSCFPGHIACDCNTHSEIVIPPGAYWTWTAYCPVILRKKIELVWNRLSNYWTQAIYDRINLSSS